MKKLIFAFCLLFISQQACASDMVGHAYFGPYNGEWCKVDKGRVSNVDGDTSFVVSANCGGKSVSGTLSEAEAFGDGASIRYFGKLAIDGRVAPGEAIVSLDPSGKSTGAVAAGGIVFDVGEIWWD